MTDGQLRDEAMTLFLAGHETTANALAWTWYLLALHPEVEARLLESLAPLGGRAATMEDVPRLGYARQVLGEALRALPAGLRDGARGAGGRGARRLPVPPARGC
jgi:cytochrome P450